MSPRKSPVSPPSLPRCHRAKPEWSPHRWSLLWAAVGVALVVLSAGCSPGETQIDLHQVNPSAGGNLATIQMLQRPDADVLVAPASDRLFVRGLDDHQWREHPATWPTGIAEPGLELFDTTRRAGNDARFDPEHYFTVFDDELWVIALPAAGEPPRLLHSDDIGKNWHEVQPPPTDTDTRRRSGSTPGMLPQMRLMTTGDELFVARGDALWRAGEFEGELEDGRRELDWQPISLAGTALDEREDAENNDADSGPGGFPVELRHYLPVEGRDDDSWELLTVHGRQLKVYRRDDGQEQFSRVATLETFDRHLVHSPREQTLFLVGPTSLYRSDDRGENWEKLEVARDSLQPEDYRRLQLRSDDEAEAGYVLWVIGDDGGLWRSEDGGVSWDEVRGRDADNRALTGVVFDDDRGRIWASTAGQGVLQSSTDDQWPEANDGLLAARPRDAVLSDPERLVVGTDAGLFTQTTTADTTAPSTFGDTWSRRATTALHIDPHDDRIVSGTAGGGIELWVDEQQDESSEVIPADATAGVEFRPPQLEGQRFPPHAILQFVSRPDSSELIAWSHRRGPMLSNDDGETWRHLSLDETFQNAIDDSVISDFLVVRDHTYVAVARPRAPQAPTQIWRSDDGGDTWQTTYTVREDNEQPPVQLVSLPEENGLLMAHGSQLSVSTDDGETWSSLSGPWESGAVTGLTVDDGQVAVVMTLAHGADIAWLDDPTGSANLSERHRLIWPADEMPEVHRPLQLRVHGENVLIHKGDAIYRGDLPRRAPAGPDRMSLVVALGAVIAMVTLAFAYLRRWET